MAEKFNLENFPTSESAKRMLSYVTQGFYDRSYVGKWIYEVMGLEYDQARKIAEELQKQCFPETATWGLMYHEIKWGLPVRENLSYEERRRLIYQKRDYRVPITPYRMEKYLEDITGLAVRVADVNDPGEYGYKETHPNIFRVYVTGEGTPDWRTVRKGLMYLKQSHTSYCLTDRMAAELDHRGLEDTALRKIILTLRMPFRPARTYDGSGRYDGSTRYDAKRRYELSMEMRICLDIGGPEGDIGNMTVETRRNVNYYDGKIRYDGSVRYDAMIRKDVIE